MSCRNVVSRLNAYLDGELSGRDRERVEQHLGECGRCREALERLRAVADALAQLPTPPAVREGFANRVLARVRLRAEPQPVVVQLWRSFSPARRVAAAAVLALGIGLGALMARDVARSSPATPSAADAAALYRLDFLADAPEGSLVDAYLTLTSGANGGGE
jgi:anti-sigma factor RsiW